MTGKLIEILNFIQMKRLFEFLIWLLFSSQIQYIITKYGAIQIEKP